MGESGADFRLLDDVTLATALSRRPDASTRAADDGDDRQDRDCFDHGRGRLAASSIC